MEEAGYVDGQNVTVDVHWADSRYERLPAMAKELAASKPAVLVAVGANQSGLAAKAATQSIPVVFGVGAAPGDHGRGRDLARPPANLTGTTLLTQQVDAKIDGDDRFTRIFPSFPDMGTTTYYRCKR